MLSSEDLHFFLQLADQPSLAALARRLDVTPSSVSQRLKLLEQKLQLRLIHRGTRQVVLTEDGETLRKRGLPILAELAELDQMLRVQKGGLGGRLRVRAPFGFGAEYVAPLLARYRARHGDLAVELDLSDHPVNSEDQAWDIIVHIGEPRDSRLVQVRLASNARFLCAAPSYLARHGVPQRMADLRDHVCIVLRENAEDASLLRLRPPGAKHYETLRLRSDLASNDGRVVRDWALAGQGIVLRSEWDVAGALADGRLVRVLPQYQAPPADIVALLAGNAERRSARIAGFLQFLKQELGARPWLPFDTAPSPPDACA